jgi:hypothetical protein
MDRNDGPHKVEDDKLIETIHKKTQDITGNHFPAPGAVEDLPRDPAKTRSDRRRDKAGEDEPRHPNDIPVHRKDKADLPRHGPQDHAKVDPHPRHDGQEQAEYQKTVAPNPGKYFLDNGIQGQPRYGRSRQGNNHKNKNHHVIRRKAVKVKLFFHFVTLVLLVSA